MKKISLLFLGLFFILMNLFYYEKEENLEFLDSSVSLMVNGKESKDFPTKESNFKVESITCNDGVIGTWDYESWNLKFTNLSNSSVKCNLSFSSIYHEDVLKGTDPILKDNLIPVTIDNDGTVHKADVTEEWYRYENQVWANAIILEDESVIYQNNEVIPESNIESYFVWIPRYKYKIFNEGNYTSLTSIENKPQTIEVEFETKDVTTSNGSKIGEWLTHPAFTAFNTNGMWVGKFETGYKGATTAATAQVNSSDSSKVHIKPNVYSWREIQVANAFTATYNYQRELESHMMKNTEWGAVAYLQHSAYGSRASVRINNNSNYITGYSANNEPTCGWSGGANSCNIYCNNDTCNMPYNTEVGYLASTTGNISGVYDMSGGSSEYVMGVMKNLEGIPVSGQNATYNSGFNGPYISGGNLSSGVSFPDEKYYDAYDYSTSDHNFQRRILGDATGEMGPFGLRMAHTAYRPINSWYDDYSYFVSSSYPWFLRNYSYRGGIFAGVFSFDISNGEIGTTVSFRVVLSF